MKTALCLGGNGFICHHLARQLKNDGYWVRVVDLKDYEYGKIDYADEVVIGDLRDPYFTKSVIRLEEDFKYSFLPKPFSKDIQFDLVFQMAACMGGALFVFTGEHDAEIMHDSALINLNVLESLKQQNFKGKVFYSSSACMYPQGLQEETNHKGLKESDAFPADPDSCYGFEKLFSEKLFDAYARNYGLNVRIARFHNIFGPEGTYKGGREKAPAAMCRKVIESKNGEIDVWGTGEQTRSFLYIDDCIEAVRLLMESEYRHPINIGSNIDISINRLAQMAIDISGKDIRIKNVPSNAIGVNGRNSDNTLIEKVLGWRPRFTLKKGMELTFKWISQQHGL